MISEHEADKIYRKQIQDKDGNLAEYRRLKRFENRKFQQAITAIRINGK